ncbi:30S ribosomal protein S8e [Fervidicoccus fontis]|uniref:Small ribosomal subunit protein eS8 n=1 Tax=Fervidicoccus fontis (strain DSM 19380 / JCM 18336 / VKM B-2539 / Kam940) TaxID=1163730 RepID=I0A2K6_FERFK|nr:30S ribosomal protein S8e [Fervidicoccus fontis]AFH43213.1 30S ribosomal protein S8e [Fervidicoccus fontis Kam940]
MGIYQENDLKKSSGGKKTRPYKVKRKALFGGYFTETKVHSEDEKEIIKVRGGNIKIKLKKASKAVIMSKDGKTVKVEKISRVVETPSNKEFARRGIITKGSIIEVESGKALVVSRPGQDGVINAVLIEK